ncbi:MAG: hypothetical protein IAE94_09580 [Chthoniobacterales bacterium]|nr:hypothetical protein [Chthoniobacterales bacterium]
MEVVCYHTDTHNESLPLAWWERAMGKILSTPYKSYCSRVNGGKKATIRLRFDGIPGYCQKHLDKKIYFTPGVFRDTEWDTPVGPMSHEDVVYDPIRVIDLDMPEDGEPADVDHIKLLGSLLPDSALILNNGCQIYMESGENWESEARMLSVIGNYLADKTGLFYDTTTHLKMDGEVGRHRNHCYRAPWGSCQRGKVRSWLPASDKMATVREVFTALGLSLPPVRPVPPRASRGTTPRKSTSANVPKGSKAAQIQEFLAIRHRLTQLVRVDNLTRQDAELEILSMPWAHHARPHLEKTLPTINLVGDGDRVPDDVWKSICADLVELPMQLGPVSNRRRLVQKTKTVRAMRAWSFEWLYAYHDCKEEAIEAFFTQPHFGKILQLSIAAIGKDAVIEDLGECWDRWWSPNYKKSPYAGLAPVSDKTLNLVSHKAKLLGVFSSSDIRRLIIRLSERQIRQALELLSRDGIITPFGGSTKGRKYRFNPQPKTPSMTTTHNLTVVPNKGTVKKNRKTTHANPPKSAKTVSFPPHGLYSVAGIANREDEIKAWLMKISLPRLKKRQKEVSEMWCEANSLDDYATEAQALGRENEWLLAVIEDKAHRDWLDKEAAKQAKLLAESPEEKKERLAREALARAKSRVGFEKKLAGLRRKRQWETISRSVDAYIEEAARRNIELSDEEIWEYRKLLSSGFKTLNTAEDATLAEGRRFDARGFIRSEIEKPAAVPQRELERQKNMMEYFQNRIDSGLDEPLAEGETLMDRVRRFDREKAEARKAVAA